MDLTGLYVFLKQCIQFLLFRRCQQIDFTTSGFSPGTSSMAWSHCLCSGRVLKDFLEKTSEYSFKWSRIGGALASELALKASARWVEIVDEVDILRWMEG